MRDPAATLWIEIDGAEPIAPLVDRLLGYTGPALRHPVRPELVARSVILGRRDGGDARVYWRVEVRFQPAGQRPAAPI